MERIWNKEFVGEKKKLAGKVSTFAISILGVQSRVGNIGEVSLLWKCIKGYLRSLERFKLRMKNRILFLQAISSIIESNE